MSTTSHLLDVYPYLPFRPESAQGVYLMAGERRIIDFYGGHAVAGLGYGHPDIVRTIETQARRLFFQSNAVALEVREEAARRLVDFAPAGLELVFFVNSGAEANENALRLACRVTGRGRILAIEHGFHGRTAAAAAVTWSAVGKWYGFPRTPFDVGFIPRNDAAAVAAMVDDSVAAVIVEPVQGQAGAFDLDAGFLRSIADACRRHGALLIADEIQTGMGRCGAPFAIELAGVQPDMLTVAKALGAGFPCSALMMTRAVAANLRHGDLGTTFGGGPLASALMSTVIEVIRRDRLIDNVQALSREIIDAMPLGPVEAVQGKGFLLGLRCRRPAKQLLEELLRRDILVGTSADPLVMRLLPPLTLERTHVHALLNALADIGPG
ncbi:acetylornithine/N-succinyldiaminopimelate aminotransferase [Gammaproteobacteria bacterium]|nr:MAG: aspartate aminotransferase family protein [Gammaproteobacteria bacterium]CAG0942756.1 acetylornithine/N-succinyldiaminopimelate aminotransferase [Gammaproteobacteria bacterium]